MKSQVVLAIALGISVCTAGRATAANKNVVSLEDLQNAIAAAQPGDEIFLADGEYNSAGAIAVTCTGKPRMTYTSPPCISDSARRPPRRPGHG